MKLVILALIGCLSLVGCSKPDDTTTKVDINGCLQSIGCSISSYGEHVQLTLPSEIIPENLFDLSLKFKGPVSHVKGYLEGVTMFMGKIPVMFLLSEEHQRYHATTILGRCGDERMKWRLILTWQDNGKQIISHKVFTISDSV